MSRAAVIKYKRGDQLPSVIDPIAVNDELPPQRLQSMKQEQKATSSVSAEAVKETTGASTQTTTRKPSAPISVEKSKKNRGVAEKERQRSASDGNEGDDDESWTEPRYFIKYRSHVDMQDYTLDNRKTGKTVPDELLLTIDLPLLRDSSALDADVVSGGYFFELKSEYRARYKLQLKLPYQVHSDSAKATFDTDKRKLTVTMKTVQTIFDKSAETSSTPSSEGKEGLYLKEAKHDGESFDLDEDLLRDTGGAGDSNSIPNLDKPIEVCKV